MKKCPYSYHRSSCRNDGTIRMYGYNSRDHVISVCETHEPEYARYGWIRVPTMFAIEQVTTGNFLVYEGLDRARVVAVISHCSKGWRVFSNIKERRSGRHTYPTPGIAAGKYWKKEPIKFVWLTDGIA